MVVFDASTLILLAKADLLRRIVERIEATVTAVVAQECTRKEELADAKLIRALIDSGDIRISATQRTNRLRTLITDFRMGAGEASSILLAQESGYVLATDDGQGIKACKLLRLPFLTAIHFLLYLHGDGAINTELAMAKLKTLERHARYSPEIVEHAARRIARED